MVKTHIKDSDIYISGRNGENYVHEGQRASVLKFAGVQNEGPGMASASRLHVLEVLVFVALTCVILSVGVVLTNDTIGYQQSQQSDTALPAWPIYMGVMLALLTLAVGMMLLVAYQLRRKLSRQIEIFSQRVKAAESEKILLKRQACDLEELSQTHVSELEDIKSQLEQETRKRLLAEQEIRQARQVAENAASTKNRLLARLNHEIRTSISGITGMSTLLLETYLNPEQYEYAQMAKQAAERLLTVINDICDFARIEAGLIGLKSEIFNLREQISDMATEMEIKADLKGIELIVDIDNDVPEMLRGDPQRLTQIVHNLLSNAVKFTNNGEVVLRIGMESQTDSQALLRFEVSDTGIGMANSGFGEIFPEPEQIDDPGSQKYGGTGLGLAIAAKLARMMGGEISMESKVGHGSTFRFTAVLDLVPQQPEQINAEYAGRLKGVRVLVVDDNVSSGKAIRKILEFRQMRVSVVRTGAEAVDAASRAQAENDEFRLAIVETSLSGEDGLETANRLTEKYGVSAAVAMISSAARLHEMNRVREHRIGYVVKPVRRAVLLDRLLKSLNIESRTAVSQHETHREELQLESCRILLAEDNAVNQKMLVRMFEKHNHTVAVANNGREAIDMLKNNDYDVVFMDVEMPKMDGVEATKIIRVRERNTGGHTPIIAMTAHAMDGDKEQFISAGMDYYISKPVEWGDITRAIATVCAEKVRLPSREVSQ